MRFRCFFRALPAGFLLPALLALGLLSPRLAQAIFNTGTGPYLSVNVSRVQPDGKIVIGGGFTSVNGYPRAGIARLLPDGQIDLSFDPNLGTNYGANVQDIVIQPDGKIIVAGNFIYFLSDPGTSPGQDIRSGVVRLNPDGSVDSTFNAGAGAGDPTTPYGPYQLPLPRVVTIALQPDGKIILGGSFQRFGGTFFVNPSAPIPSTPVRINDETIFGLVRLNPDGSRDRSFDVGFGPGRGLPYPGPIVGDIFKIQLQPDGKLLVGGNFTFFDAAPRRAIVRLTTTGDVDSTFNPGLGATGSDPAGPGNGDTGAGGTVQALALQADGKVVIGGTFALYNGVPRQNLARVAADGTLDLGWNAGSPAGQGTNGNVVSLVLQPDGKLLLGGTFTTVRGITRVGIARLNADSSLDNSFVPGTGVGGQLLSITLQGDGQVLIAGTFVSYNNVSIIGIARLNPTGTLESATDGGTGTDPTGGTIASPGSADVSFTSNPGAGGGFIFGLGLQQDGKVVVAGSFTTYNSTPAVRVARLNADGTPDGTFSSGRGPNGWAYSVVIAPDGKIYIGGSFTDFNGSARFGVARLNADGSVDAGFNTAFGPNGTVLAMAIQPDGKILIGGFFTLLGNSVPRNAVARLNADGSFDPTFNPGDGADGTVRALTLQSDGKIYVGGDFRSFGPYAANRYLRLNSNGSVDTSYGSSIGADGPVYGIALQLDGKAIIVGAFGSVGGVNRNRIARLNPDGSPDTTFNLQGAGPNGIVRVVTVTRDGRILVAGDFTQYNGLDRFFARLNADGSLDTSVLGGTTTGSNSGIRALVVQPDGFFLIAGNATFSTTVPDPQPNFPDNTRTISFNGIVRVRNPLPLGRLVNLSTRARVETGDGVMIGGFVVNGSAPKRILVRVLGPSLAAVGVTGTLSNPSVEVFNSAGTLVASNDNWQDKQSAAIQSTLLAPSNSLEAAILFGDASGPYAALVPGAYTAVVRGVGNSAGVAIVEAYDLDVGSAPRLINLSTRARAGTGDNVIIGGFVTRQGVSRVLVRALGPSLASVIPGALTDTRLTIMDAQGNTVSTNDDWASNVVQADNIRATGLAPSNAKEAAILIDLPQITAGGFTAIVSSPNGTTGIALIEVYEIR